MFRAFFLILPTLLTRVVGFDFLCVTHDGINCELSLQPTSAILCYLSVTSVSQFLVRIVCGRLPGALGTKCVNLSRDAQQL